MEARETQVIEKNSFGIWIASGLIFAVACFVLAALRRPLDADLLGGGLGLIAAAAAWALQGVWKRSQLRWENWRQFLAQAETRNQTVVANAAADREAAEKRRYEEFENLTGALRRALESGLQGGFASVAPALTDGMGTSMAAMTDGLRAEREERTRMLHEIQDAYSGLQSAQREASQAMTAAWNQWRDQAQVWQQQFSAREAGWQSTWERIDQVIAALPIVVAKLSDTIRGGIDAEWKDRLREFSAAWREMLEAAQAQVERSAGVLAEGAQALAAQNGTAQADAGARLREVAEQAEAWLGGLQSAGQKLESAFEGAQRFGEAAAVHHADLKAAVEMLEQGMTGVLDRLQSLAALGQGHEALLEKMDVAVHRFEERAAELLEENALKAQESLLEVLDREQDSDVETVPEDPDLIRATEAAEAHGD